MLNKREYQAFLALLAPKNAGDMFTFNFPDRSIERVGDLFALTQDFILTGTTFVLIPDLIKMFEKVWCTFIRSQRVDGSWNVDPITYFSTEEDKIKVIYQPTVIALACLLQGITYFPSISCEVADIAIEQAIHFILTKILDNSRLIKSNHWWKFCSWMIRIFDRPKRDEMEPLKQIFVRIEQILNESDLKLLQPKDVIAACEIQLRLNEHLVYETKKTVETSIAENALMRILETRSICHVMMGSQNINVEDLLWLPFWKLNTSCTRSQLLAAFTKKIQEIEDIQIRQLIELVFQYQVNHFLFFEEKASSNNFQK